VGKFRTWITGHPHSAWLLLAAVLTVRAIVPAGYMVGSHNGFPTIELCDGMVSVPAAPPTMAMHDMSAMSAHHHGHPQDTAPKKPADGTMPCAFAAASFNSLISADPVLPLVALWIIAATVVFGRHATFLIRADFAHARPFLRGPPALR
jgi:hypothetical protein